MTENLPELTRRQKVVGPLFDIANSNIESGRNDANFVQSTSQVDNDFATTVIIDDLEFANVPVLHHDLKKADDDL